MTSTTDLNQIGDARDVVGEHFGFLFAKMHLRCARVSVEVLREAGLGFSGMHVGVMAMIESRGPMSQHAVGEALGKDRTTMVSVVDELEREGLVERRRNPADRRAYALEVTEAGRDWLEKARAVLSSMEPQLLAGLDEDDRETLRAMLQRVVFDAPMPDAG
jgi:DNA-binding MarR family transcriptional regulator